MKLSTLMMVNAIVGAVFGLGFVFAPGQVTSLYSPEVGVTLRYVAQLFGAALLGFAVLTWVARRLHRGVRASGADAHLLMPPPEEAW